MRWLWIPAIALFLSGCALPPAVTIASFAIDAGSYLVSGKTVTDHGLSLALDRNCSMIRVFEGHICEEDQTYEVAQAALAPLPESNGESSDIGPTSGPEPGPVREPQPSDYWSAVYDVQLASRPHDRGAINGGYLAAEFIQTGL